MKFRQQLARFVLLLPSWEVVAGIGHPGTGSSRRTPRLQTPNRSFGVYFHGDREPLRLRSNRIGGGLPLGEFTVEVRVRPEGGQQNPSVITGYHDTCSYIPNDKGWMLGISLMDENRNRDPRFFFSLRTDRAPRASTIHDRRAHRPSTWAHLVSTYDGRSMALYVDGVLVGKRHEQKGNVSSVRFRVCKALTLGGDRFESLHNYRGAIELFRLWGRALSHYDVRALLTDRFVRKDSPGLIISDHFGSIRHFWSPGRSKRIPELVLFPRRSGGDLLKGRGRMLPIPRCGKTVCDNLDIIRSYNKHWTFRRRKVIRYQVVNIFNDDHEEPTVTSEQISLQHAHLASVFGAHNITWELTVTEVLNSSLRHRIVLATCELSHLADGFCDPECNHSSTGYDAGDCLPGRAECLDRRPNGLCEARCNGPVGDFDGGDCCNVTITDVTKTCFDPESSHRAFLTVPELKDVLHLDGSSHLNVFFANILEEDLAGVATWPWSKDALSHMGGIALNPSYYGRPGHTHTMIHEVGHALGLYHVFRGLSEIESCDDPCLEVEPSMETGDLCEDTPPVRKHKLCSDPDPGNISCGLPHLENTPFNNFMSYADGKCPDRFTPNQVARMHCYLDLVYLSWRGDHSSAPVPLPPWVVAQDAFQVTLEWLPALSDSLYHRVPGLTCENCAVDGSLVQFAGNASSNRDCDPSGHWSPREAEGRPDVETPCKVNLHTWSPELRHQSGDISLPCPQPEGCVLNLSFTHPVPATTLTIWVTFISTRVGPPLNNVVLLLANGSRIALGPLRVTCDVPLTVNLPSGSIVSNVELYSFDEKVEIDAVALTSEPGCLLCQACQPLGFEIERKPPFHSGSLVSVPKLQLQYEDREVKAGEVYIYRVRGVTLTGVSQFTPSLTHRFNSPYCGDGSVHSVNNEECDDGNISDGDGCSHVCMMEKHFHCRGEPSLCYLHAGDGTCEDFEKGKVQEDCGFTLPPDMIDQWAFEVSLSQGGLICPSQAMIGGPPLLECFTSLTEWPMELENHTLLACASHQQWQSNHLLRLSRHNVPYQLWANFSQPFKASHLVLYSASDGVFTWDHSKKYIHVTLIQGVENQFLGRHAVSCHHNPLVLKLKPGRPVSGVLVEFWNPNVSFSGIALQGPLSHMQVAPPHFREPPGCCQPASGDNTCPPLQIMHAQIGCPFGLPENECKPECEEGHVLLLHSKRTKVQCKEGAWTPEPSCIPLDCGTPYPSHVDHAEISCPNGTTFKKQCTFHCPPPSQLQGSDVTLTCLADGLWSFPEASCQLVCATAPVLSYARLRTKRCGRPNHEVGTVCKYRCLPGYQLSFISGNRKNFSLECTENGSWAGGSCQPIQCPPLPAILHGLYHCSRKFEAGSRCRLKCPGHPEHSSTVKCNKKGRWNGQLKLCPDITGECPPPQSTAEVLFLCDIGYRIGALCQPTCTVPLTDPVIPDVHLHTGALAPEINATRIKHITCAGAKHWYQDPSIICCIPSCEDVFKGDGWCDPKNNRAYCEYDGGDCCASTLQSKEVIPFGGPCDLQGDCACRDPAATENHARRHDIGRG
uniref:pappalysin-1-like n=1 Tax=Myxine glutinosa TaxID=7769 RepID=UPI00358E3B5D